MIVSAIASLRSMLGQGPQPSTIQRSVAATSSSFRVTTFSSACTQPGSHWI